MDIPKDPCPRKLIFIKNFSATLGWVEAESDLQSWAQLSQGFRCRLCILCVSLSWYSTVQHSTAQYSTAQHSVNRTDGMKYWICMKFWQFEKLDQWRVCIITPDCNKEIERYSYDVSF
jgi:hypothetical protein